PGRDQRPRTGTLNERSERMEMAGRRQPPTVRRRRLAAELSGLRATAKLTREQVAEETGLSIGALFRIEKAQSRPQKRTLVLLLDLYGVTDKAERAAFVELLRQSNELGWLQPFESALPESYQAFISFESESSRLTDFEQAFVPGLLQTSDYARAVIRGIHPNLPMEDVESRAEVRVRRQGVLTKKNPVDLWAVMDEAVLHRTIGGADVMRAQMERLTTEAHKPNITIQVVPYGAGAHPGLQGAFVVMEFPAPNPALVYVETMTGELFLEKEAEVEQYLGNFKQLIALAASPTESLRMIQQAVESA
ncbi:MAG TPA: helix-turn-helix transcriptional regulator, partial [Actinoplanes sp.]